MSPPSSREPSTEPATGPVACALCGVTAPSLPLGWSTSFDRGRAVHHCAACAREHVRSMEGKLDSEWWS